MERLTDKLKKYLANASEEQLVNDYNCINKIIGVNDFLMTKKEFYEKYLNGVYFSMDTTAVENAIVKLANKIGYVYFNFRADGKWYCGISDKLMSSEDTEKLNKSKFSIFEVVAIYESQVFQTYQSVIEEFIERSNKELIDKYTEYGDKVVFEDGSFGIVIQNYGDLEILKNNSSISKIASIYRPDNIEDVASMDAVYSVVYPDEETCFVGVSYQADSTLKSEVIEYMENSDYEVLEYDFNKSETANHDEIAKADRYIMIPPADFEETHIIGLGLYNQYMTRKEVDKEAEVALIDGSYATIKKVYKLTGTDYTKAAVVIF